MGDPRRARKSYSSPSHPWQLARIDSEAKLIGEYGLKNHRELWKHYRQLGAFRKRARLIAAMGDTENAQALKREMFSKLYRLGILTKKDPSLDEILSLEIKDFLERRLQTVVFRRGMAHTPDQARQFIVHGHVCMGGNRITIPSLTVENEMESQIEFNSTSSLSKPHPSVPKVAKEEDKVEQIKREIAEAKGEAGSPKEGEKREGPKAEEGEKEDRKKEEPKKEGSKAEKTKGAAPVPAPKAAVKPEEKKEGGANE